ncbi:DUF1508 domain-containing protein [Natrialbaceae archaeon AArc-T1-2]|uniref:DUF1508 domain-containing protein n=1 Tax=Natrialbaceae archaeon AArc-T1-2 TaxID=3053904 RepID=UPI00255B3304|nr:DUF1508 domain-containing protein [Natrialbaceae archaeon AArc-T1-2]WIV66384.1 DUF1508 domain-containing protein [Natrialbaceae archaeon AArc-T1-2]
MSGLSDAHDKLFRLYEHYVGEPDSAKDVYGYWLFIVGYVVGAAGVFTFVVGYAAEVDSFFHIRVSAVTAAAGLSIGLFGIVLMLPVRRRGIQAGVVGLLVALVGVGSFGVVYPSDWRGHGADYSVEVIMIYTTGLVIIAGVTALVPVVTGRKGMFVEEEGVTDDPPILTGDALEGAQFAVFRDENGDWVWHVLHLEALARSEERAINRPAAESDIDDVRSKIGSAGLMEITTSAFRLYEDETGRWRWLLMREDGSVVADATREFDDRDGVEESVSFLKDRGPEADVVDIDGAAFNYYEDDGEWRWRLLDDDRSVLATDESGYRTQAGAEDAASAFADQFDEARLLTISHLGVELRERGEGWHWRFVDERDDVVAESTVTFETRRDAEDATEALLSALGSASVTVAGEPTFELYERGENWRWRLVDAGEQVVARSPSDLESDRHGERQIDRFGSSAADADVVEIDGAEYEVYPEMGEKSRASGDEDDEGDTQWRWRLVTDGRDVVADSTTPHADPADARDAIDRMRRQASEADLIEFENAAFQVYEADDGEWRWRLIDEDGTVLADSGEEHTSRDEAAQAMMTLKEQAPDAELLEIDTAAFELFRDEDDRWGWRLIDEGGKLVAEDPTTHPTRGAAKQAMDRLVDHLEADVRTMERAIFQLESDEEGWHWRFVLPTNDTVARGEGTHPTRDELLESLGRVRETAENGSRHTIGDVTVQLYGDDEWRWRLLERDRSVVAESADAYAGRDVTLDAVERVTRHAADAPIFTIETAAIRLSDRDGWAWELIEADRETLGVCGETYAGREAAVDEIDRIRRLAPAAGRVEFDVASFELYESDDGWRWRLIDANGTTVATGVERYATGEKLRDDLENVRELIDHASILEIDGAAFELHATDDDGWIWKLVDEHGATMAESTRVYETRTDAREAMNDVKSHAPDGWITFTE